MWNTELLKNKLNTTVKNHSSRPSSKYKLKIFMNSRTRKEQRCPLSRSPNIFKKSQSKNIPKDIRTIASQWWVQNHPLRYYENRTREEMNNFSDASEILKRENNRDQDNMIDRLPFQAICSIRFELENSNFEFLFLLNPRYDAKSDRFCEFLKSIFIKKNFISKIQFLSKWSNYFSFMLFSKKWSRTSFSFELFQIGNGSKYLEIAR